MLEYKHDLEGQVTGHGPIETIFGNLQGLKSSQLRQLQRLYHQRVSGNFITTSEFAQRLAAISTEINQPICSYINRKGKVIRVGVGTVRQTQIPPMEIPRYGAERLSGIRCIATNLKSEPPHEAALTAMLLQRLDALVILNLTGTGFTKRGGGATGYVKGVYLAHLVCNSTRLSFSPSSVMTVGESRSPDFHVSPPLSLDAIAQMDFLGLVEGLEAEFEREYVGQEVNGDHDRVIVVGVFTDDVSDQQFQDTIAELARLVDTAGGEVLESIQQKRSRIHPQTVIGEGKVQEVALTAQTRGANLIVFDRDLSPAQVRNLESQIGVRVVDRTEVILDIFAQRAQSGAGKLQVELAQLEYMLPRLTGRGRSMSRLGGGIGTRGPGETKLETERRAIQRRISRLQQEVNQLQAHRCRLRQKRQHREIPSVALVGYTNAGKSTLLNALTNAQVYTADQLFATLDPTTRRLVIPQGENHQVREALITDTVGFIHELPNSLMDAFRATLEEVTEADALIHLVDLSHPAWLSHIRSVREILAQMPITPGPALVVFNKIDRVNNQVLVSAREEFPLSVFISAGQRLGLETLRLRLSQLIEYALEPMIQEQGF
ncbi:GTPase HflX [Cylindrospermopsis raciborskii CHAB3438]|uniref:GTPase HflX n=1 Tax=Cylindrospermopsis raciborskii TaxID=77022 RepID=UPI001F0FB5D5|nr:GTPase HflX [Cylindrospermopsis raciborskii]MCH4904526.1 GTPase HflX [Cylindrospermopsis raciborskii CHAB3438]